MTKLFHEVCKWLKLFKKVVLVFINTMSVIPPAVDAFWNGQSVGEFLGLIDPLTKLPNLKALDQFKAKCKREIGVIYSDVDSFKSINDTFSHGFGNKWLINIANAILEGVKDLGSVYRIHGDEMCIVSNDWVDIKSLERELRSYVMSKYGFSVTFGTAFGDPKTVLHNADRRMYKNKKHPSTVNCSRFSVMAFPDQRRSKFDRRVSDRIASLN